jgi:hypothetical protein
VELQALRSFHARAVVVEHRGRWGKLLGCGMSHRLGVTAEVYLGEQLGARAIGSLFMADDIRVGAVAETADETLLVLIEGTVEAVEEPEVVLEDRHLRAIDEEAAGELALDVPRAVVAEPVHLEDVVGVESH